MSDVDLTTACDRHADLPSRNRSSEYWRCRQGRCGHAYGIRPELLAKDEYWRRDGGPR